MEKINTQYTRVVRLADVYTETGTDYSLPDYNGDIKKVFYATAAVLPSASFVDGDVINASGTVNYDVIYLDSENNMDILSFSSEYEFPIKVDSEKLLSSDIETKVSNFSYRLFGPRKISAKATLQSEVRLVESAEIETVCSGKDSDYESVKKTLPVEKSVFLSAREREYSDTLATLEGYTAEEISIIYTSIDATVESSLVNSNGVTVKGEIVASALVKSDGEVPILYKKHIPFEELVSSDQVDDGMSAVCRAEITSTRTNVVATDDGVAIEVSVGTDFSLRCYGNSGVEVTLDAYLKSVECNTTYEKFEYVTHLATECFDERISMSIPVSDLSESGIRDIVLMKADAKGAEVSFAGNFITIEGEMKLVGICTSVSDDGTQTIFSVKHNLPIKKTVNANISLPKSAKTSANCQIHNLSVSVDEENVYVDADMKIEFFAESEGSVDRLSSCAEKDGGERYVRTSVITVYYPDKEDSLFSVAKAHHTSAGKIAADNMLSESVLKMFDKEGSLAGVERLIIK